MREILFRGRDIAHNWHYGVPLIFTEDYVCMTAPHTYNKAVQPETVGQFTGLTDRNGKRIFEGDILDCGDRIVRVSWHEMCGTWDCNFVRYKGKLCSNGITPVEWKYRAEIIGNIHDNPELLEVTQ